MYVCIHMYLCMCSSIFNSFHLFPFLVLILLSCFLPSFLHSLLSLPSSSPSTLSPYLTFPFTPYSTQQLTVMKTRGKPEVSAQSSAEQVNKIIHCLYKYSIRFTFTNYQYLLHLFLNSKFITVIPCFDFCAGVGNGE